MVTFGGWGWRDKQKDILQKQSHGRDLQKRCSRLFGKFYRKTAVQDPFLKKKFEAIKTFQNCFFIVHLRITASDLIEYLETLTIN